MYAYIHHVYMYIRIHFYMYTYKIHVHIRTNVYMYMRVYTCTYEHTHSYTRESVCVRLQPSVHCRKRSAKMLIVFFYSLASLAMQHVSKEDRSSHPLEKPRYAMLASARYSRRSPFTHLLLLSSLADATSSVFNKKTSG